MKPSTYTTFAAVTDAADLGLKRHLLSRTHFGFDLQMLEACSALSYDACVEQILEGTRDDTLLPMPDTLDDSLLRRNRSPISDEERTQLQALLRRARSSLKIWWVAQMMTTPTQLREKMTLFWHNHFVSAIEKVRSPLLMARQNMLFRSEATGSFRRLLESIVHDPAMLVYLDNISNAKNSPNENLGRELLELFTLGEGNYTEDDVKAAARALTGYSVSRRDGTFRFVARLHDFGVKTFLGQEGNFDAEDIVRIILEQDATAVFIVRKLWREFISDAPNEAEVQRMAALFRNADYEIEPLLRAMLLSDAFKQAPQRLIKSPVELLVGLARMFNADTALAEKIAQGCKILGQTLFDPPNVKGWPGYTAWIDTQSLLQRRHALAKAADMLSFAEVKPEPGLLDTLALWLLGTDALTTIPNGSVGEAIIAMTEDPVFELK